MDSISLSRLAPPVILTDGASASEEDEIELINRSGETLAIFTTGNENDNLFTSLVASNNTPKSHGTESMAPRTLTWLCYWLLVSMVSLIALVAVAATGDPGAHVGGFYVLVDPFLLLAMLFLFLLLVVGPMPSLGALHYYRSVLAGQGPSDSSDPPTKVRTAIEVVFATLVTYAVTGTLLFSGVEIVWGVPGLLPTLGEVWFVIGIVCLFLCSLLWPVLWITR